MRARELPAEWARQDGILLTWPHAQGDWGDDLPAVEQAFVAIAAAAARHERVLIACHDPAHRQRIAGLLADEAVPANRIVLALAPSNDSWARDHGPITVLDNGHPRLLDFRFNGWGGKYPADLDDAVTRKLADQGVFGDTPLETVDLVLEGGAIDTDGRGALLATRRSIVSEARNPGLDQAAMEAMLARHLGVRRFLWLEHGRLAGDDTDGHIDTLARFCDEHTIAYVACEDRADTQHDELAAMADELHALRTATGEPYRLVPLPLPKPCYGSTGQRLPATYANFLIVNGAVLVPVYHDPADAIALERLGGCFPDRRLVPIDCRALIGQNGSLHCVTMQLPVGVLMT